MTHQQATPTAAQIIEACQRVPSARPSAEETQVLIAEIERLRLLTRRLANAVVTGQRYEGLICQAEDFLRGEQSTVTEQRPGD